MKTGTMDMVKERPHVAVMRRLARLGFPRTYVKQALPEWWEDCLWGRESGFAQGAMILSRNLGLDLVSFCSTSGEVKFEHLSQPKFKRTSRGATRDVSVAQAVSYRVAVIAAAATRRPFRPFPPFPGRIRRDVIEHGGAANVNLNRLLDYCWDSGIPVVHVNEVPTGARKFDGMTALIDGRPVIVLANNHAFAAWQVFILAHELGHVAMTDLSEAAFLVDADMQVKAKDKEEEEADAFAAELLMGNSKLHYTARYRLNGTALAEAARRAGGSSMIDPGVVALNYGYHNDMMPAAMNALKLLEPHPDALELIREKMARNLDPGLIDEHSYRWLTHLTRIDDPL
jgi:hypothetical protein